MDVLPLPYVGVHPVNPPPCPCYPHQCCCVHSALPSYYGCCSPFLRTPLLSLPRPIRAFAPVKEKTGAAQEEQEVGGGMERRKSRRRGRKEWKREKVEGKRGAYEQAKMQLLFSLPFPRHPAASPGDFGEFSRRRYYALFFLLPFTFFRAGYPLSCFLSSRSFSPLPARNVRSPHIPTSSSFALLSARRGG